jgi:hypothetical protein
MRIDEFRQAEAGQYDAVTLTRWRLGVRVPTSLPLLIDLPRFAVFSQASLSQTFSVM